MKATEDKKANNTIILSNYHKNPRLKTYFRKRWLHGKSFQEENEIVVVIITIYYFLISRNIA